MSKRGEGVPEGIISTCEAAALTKLSCARLGYFGDEKNGEGSLIDCLLRQHEHSQNVKNNMATMEMRSGHVHRIVSSSSSVGRECEDVLRPFLSVPLINRGTFARARAVRSVVAHFIKSCFERSNVANIAEDISCVCQVVSLGAGLDALPFDLNKEGLLSRVVPIDRTFHDNEGRTRCKSKRLVCKYIETDVSIVVKKKMDAIINCRDRLLQDMILMKGLHGQQENKGQNVVFQENVSGIYGLGSANVLSTEELKRVLDEFSIDYGLPTLIILECVIVYSKTVDTERMLQYLSKIFSKSAVVVYEQVKLSDPYGCQMMKNLEDRGCPLHGISKTPRELAVRLQKAGWAASGALDMLQVWENERLIGNNEKLRATKLEGLDEFEEWNLIQRHYVLAIASAGPLSFLLDDLGFDSL